jgi:hypothetical protein
MTQGKPSRVRVLYLDNDYWTSLKLYKGMTITITPEILGRFPIVSSRVAVSNPLNPTRNPLEVYNPTAAVLAVIKQAAESGQFPCVVIGNNMGAGLKKAVLIPVDLRQRTIIIWNRYYPGDEKEYAALGYSLFMSRHELAEKLALLIKSFR